MNTKDNVLIIRPDLAQFLLDKGHRIVAIAKNRFDPARTVFYFRPANGLKEDAAYFLKYLSKGEKEYEPSERI